MRVLFTTAPLNGHFFPLVPLAWACRSLGHTVLVMTSDHFVQTALSSGLPVTAVGPGIALHELADLDAANGISDARYAHGETFAAMAANNLPGTLAVVDSWLPDVLVSERAELAGPIAAASRGIPHVELQWGVPELGEYRAAAEPALRTRLRRLGLEALPTPDAIVNPWPPSLRHPHAAGHLGLRHVQYDGVSRVSGWILEPTGRPRICFTLGTVLPRVGNIELVRAMVAGLSELDCELVVAVDDDLATRLRPLPPAVRHAGRVPLSEVVRTCDVLVHHGGNGTSLTALAAGCPQVVLPQFDDQHDNAAAVAASGAGLTLPLDQATPHDVVTYTRQVHAAPHFRTAARTVAGEIAAQPTPTDVVAVLERLAHRRTEAAAA